MPELADLPYHTPAVTCWVPGGDEAAQQLGVVRYLLKPVTRETLFATLEELENVESVLLVDDKVEVLQLFARVIFRPIMYQVFSPKMYRVFSPKLCQ